MSEIWRSSLMIWAVLSGTIWVFTIIVSSGMFIQKAWEHINSNPKIVIHGNLTISDGDVEAEGVGVEFKSPEEKKQ